LTNYDYFLKTLPNIMKKCLIFYSNFFYSICFESTKKTFQNGYFYFSRRWPYIFYMLFEKSYDIFLGFSVETIWKYIENFPNFLFKNFQTNFCEILSCKYLEWLFSLYLNMYSFCFFALLNTLNHTFLNESTDRQKYSKAFITKN
jgi:hypothetical protein